MLHKPLIVISGSYFFWCFKVNFFPYFIFLWVSPEKISWINLYQQWQQMNETNATKKAFALCVIETEEREGLFDLIWEIDTLKNMVDEFK